ncbi:MAG: hypothetical protein FWC42_01890 [Proteobacteria bacterium]|nr:hypothetical protein [Pseudomonadota bacterium]
MKRKMRGKMKRKTREKACHKQFPLLPEKLQKLEKKDAMEAGCDIRGRRGWQIRKYGKCTKTNTCVPGSWKCKKFLLLSADLMSNLRECPYLPVPATFLAFRASFKTSSGR